MRFRMPGATAIAAALVAIAAPAPLAFAQNGGQAAVQVSRDVVQPLNEARAALGAQDWATAKTKLDAATAKAKTPADRGQIDRLRAYLGAQTKDGPMQVASITALLSGGTLTPDETKQYKGALAKAHLDSGDTVASLAAYRTFIDEYGGTADQLISIANDSSKASDHANAVIYSERAIAKAGETGTAPESWHRLLMRSYRAQNQMDKYYAAEAATLTAYPSSENAESYWRDLIAHAQEAPGFSAATRLDLFRTLLAAGVKLTAQERSMAADEAVKRGLPNEALTLLEAAAAAGEPATDFDKATLASSKTAVAADKAGLAKETTDILAKGDGAAIASIGEAQLSYGDNAKAVEVLKAAIAKGIADPGELALAKLHLGIAQYRAGDKAAATATWGELKGDTAVGVLADRWTLISKLK